MLDDIITHGSTVCVDPVSTTLQSIMLIDPLTSTTRNLGEEKHFKGLCLIMHWTISES